MPQYDCHYCHEREVAVIHNGYGSCKQCKKDNVNHSKCGDDCNAKKDTDECFDCGSKIVNGKCSWKDCECAK